MALSITISDIQRYEPNILDYGVDSFENEMSDAAADVTRDIRTRWWPTQETGRYDISIIGQYVEMDADKLTASQWTRAVVYYCLGYYVFPKLSSFNSEADIFERKFEYYRKEYDREFQAVLMDGTEYDHDNDGVIQSTEKEPTYYLKLKR
jgi:hypothetical protein